jgi:hypothetical protein
MRRASFIFLLTAACGGFYTPEADPEKIPGPALIGRIDAGLRAADEDPLEVHIEVDRIERAVLLAPDGTFAVKSLPEGEAHVHFGVGAVMTGIDLTGLQKAELVEVDLKATAAEIHVESLRRNSGRLAYHMPVRRSSGVEVLESDVVFFFEPGEYAGGIEIRGHRVAIFGQNADEPCADRRRARFRGDIIVRGSDVHMFDIDTRGAVRIGGERVRVHSPCDNLWTSDTAPKLIDDGPGDLGPIIIF